MKIIEVVGHSMNPTLRDGQLVLCREKFSFKINKIYVVRLQNKLFIKRLIGLPNQNIQFISGEIYVGGEYINSMDYTLDSNDYEWNTGINGVVLLGDNLHDSLDSRKLGVIAADQVRYEVIAKVWPPGLVS
ncbi:MAG: signal peptidase I [Candidatus Heimdallarchaeota archaeon]|nr:signal peptidase I [Candidatus Heimdallarchaeota archaeon]